MDVTGSSRARLWGLLIVGVSLLFLAVGGYLVDRRSRRLPRGLIPGRVHPGGTSARSDRGWAEGVVDDYREGETVTAYYDPSTPSDAYLVQRRDLTKFAFVVLPLVLLATGVLFLWRASWADDDGETSGPTTGEGASGTDGVASGDRRDGRE